MRARVVPLCLRHFQVAADENAIPWDFYVLEIDHGVVLVEAGGERIVEDGGRVLLVAAPRHQRQAFSRQRHRRRERIRLVAGLQCLKAGHEQFVRHDATGRQHLGATNGDAIGVFVDDRGDKLRVGLIAGGFRLVGLRIDDHVRQEQVVIARIGEIMIECRGAGRVIGAEGRKAHAKSGESRSDVIRRAADHPAGEPSPLLKGAAALQQLFVIARQLPGTIDLTAARRRPERHLLNVGRLGLEIIKPRRRGHCVCKRLVLGYVCDPSAVDINRTSVAQARQIRLPVLRRRHRGLINAAGDRCQARRPLRSEDRVD